MPPTRRSEASRLKALKRYAVLDSPPEASFDRITHLASCLFETPIALISLIDQKRQWFKSCVGIEPVEVDREIAFCAHAILSDGVLVVPDALEDPRFHDNPQVTGAPFIRFYAGAPLVTLDGFRLGTFCIADTVPRTFSPAQAANLQHFAAMVMETLEARRATAPLAAALESTASGVVICDPNKPDVPIVFANPAFCAITGYRREEILGRNCRFLQGPDTDPAAVARMRAAVTRREPFHGTLRNYRQDGTPFWNALNFNPVFDDFGELVSFVGVQVDTTAQVEALEQARQSEDRLAVAQRVAQIGSWECAFTASGDLDQKSVIWSDETYRLVGLAREDGADLWAHSYRCVHPDFLHRTRPGARRDVLRTHLDVPRHHRAQADGSIPPRKRSPVRADRGQHPGHRLPARAATRGWIISSLREPGLCRFVRPGARGDAAPCRGGALPGPSRRQGRPPSIDGGVCRHPRTVETEYISKPFQIPALLALLDNVLRNKKGPARKRS